MGTKSTTARPTVKPSDLIRFWLRRAHTHSRLDVPGFARALGVSAPLIHHWLRDDKRGIPDRYWEGIARFFEHDTPEALLASARVAYTRATRQTRG